MLDAFPGRFAETFLNPECVVDTVCDLFHFEVLSVHS